MSPSVEATLADYHNWYGVDLTDRCPAVIGLLGDGSNNQSVLVANRNSFVIRVNVRDQAVNELDWNTEQAALMNAAAAGLAPALRYSNPRAGVLVCDFLAPDPDQSVSPQSLAHLLFDIHRLPGIRAVLSLNKRIMHYERLLLADPVKATAAAPILRFSRPAADCAQELQESDTDRVLCHNDLLPANRLLCGGKLWAIDWEYAAMGSRWFDLAVVACGESFDRKDRQVLLERYLRRPPARHELKWLNLAAVAYRYLESLWIAANRDAFDPAIAVSLLNSELAKL